MIGFMGLLIGWSVVSTSTSTSTDGRTCLRVPVSAPVVAKFVAPACPYCAGHRTLDFAAQTGSEVFAPIAGTVTFAGIVAGTRYVTITLLRHTRDVLGSPGITGDQEYLETARHLVTIGGVFAHSTVVDGSIVAAGQHIGTAVSTPVRLSVRRVVQGGPGEYLDPEPSVERWRAPIRLVPDPTHPEALPRKVRSVWSCRRPL